MRKYVELAYNWAILVGWVVAAAWLFSVGLEWSITSLRHSLRETYALPVQEEAVQHGAATWQVDADGERVFRWNESEAECE